MAAAAIFMVTASFCSDAGLEAMQDYIRDLNIEVCSLTPASSEALHGQHLSTARDRTPSWWLLQYLDCGCAVHGVQGKPHGGHGPGPALTDSVAIPRSGLRKGGACARRQQPHSDLRAPAGGCAHRPPALAEGQLAMSRPQKGRRLTWPACCGCPECAVQKLQAWGRTMSTAGLQAREVTRQPQILLGLVLRWMP